MARIAYVNGRYAPIGADLIQVEDRGFQFADGVYEVWTVRGGRLLDSEGHFTRLKRSLDELRIAAPMRRDALAVVLEEVRRRNKVRDGLLYLQVTRGAAPRDHAFPDPARKPTLVVTARPGKASAADARAAAGVGVITHPDLRWKRCDIKTVSLLPNALAKQAARAAGAHEAWLVDETGMVTEGASSNAWIVTKDGRLVTRQADNGILKGITRETVRRLAQERQLTLEERAFSLEEAHAATEAFMTSASALVTPVTAIDGRPVGEGTPGPVAKALREDYLKAQCPE